MISKLRIVEQELDETQYWFELLVESEIVTAEKLRLLMQESDELLRIVTASLRTLKRRVAADKASVRS
jgi:four helix bundle protein